MYIHTEFIPVSERASRVCYRCGTTKSVKYKRVYDFGTLDFCNMCQLREQNDASVLKARKIVGGVVA